MKWLIKLFIKDYENVSNPKVRQQYGLLVSIVSILINVILAFVKFIVGILTNSISIQADALNNFSDAGSNLATLFGFKLASKHPDADHPYGHGRLEYISGLIIAFLILLVSISSLKNSVMKMFFPTPIRSNFFVVFILIISIICKLYMGLINQKYGKKINSTALKAAAQDSFNDTISTMFVLISILLYHFTSKNVDGLFGIIVSLFVFKSGLEVFKETIHPLLGQAPDKDIVKGIEELVCSNELVIGIHDFMLHDYGPGRSFVTLHVEVDSKMDLLNIHDEIDSIERKILKNFNILATIHIDPIDLNNEIVQQLKKQVMSIVKNINDTYSIHDFRMVVGKKHTNIIFDVEIPASDMVNTSCLKQEIINKVQKINPSYDCVIQIDRTFY